MSFDYTLTPDKKNRFIKYNIKEKYNPEITIVTATYNTQDFIFDTAKTVLNQSYPWFEWLIVDDGSTNKESLERLKELEKKDKRIQVLHKKNSGTADSRNYGAKKANKSSKYLIFLDDDDLIELNYLECTYFALENNPSAAFAYPNSVGFGELEYVWEKKFNIKRHIDENVLVVTALIRKDAFFSVGGFDIESKGISEDWVFWTKLFCKESIPVRLNYIGFWYRRKKVSKLTKDTENANKTKDIVESYRDKINYDIEPIEYPKSDYDWDDVCRKNYEFTCPTKTNAEKKNILMIVPHVVMGGADKFNIDFLKGLDAEKYSVTLIITNINKHDWLQEISKYVDSYYILPSFLDRKNWNYFLDYLIEKNNTELILNTNSIYGYMVLPFLKSRHKDIRILDYIHMEEWYNRNGGYSRDSSSFGSIIDLTLTCNDSSTKILKNYFKRNKDDVKTCYIGVDEEKFKNTFNVEELKEKYNVDPNRKIISFICRITYQKRPFLLLEIMKEIVNNRKDVLFLICGDGELEAELKYKVEDNNLLDYVKFLGRIKDTQEIYAISDMTINCSIKEGLALTAYESLSMGVPVVSSNVGGQAELIDKTVGAVIDTTQKEEDVYKYEYDKDEINQFVEETNKVLNNLSYYKKNCRKRILSGFTIKQMNINMNKYIDELMNKKTSKRFDNEDVAKELLNQYLLSSEEEYKYLITKHYQNIDIPSESTIRFKEKAANLFDKMHLYYESRIIYSIYCCFKSIIINIVKIIVLIVKIPLQIIRRIINIFKKIIRKIIK